MMNGTLEAKKEATHLEELVRPSFADEPPETLTTEQQQQACPRPRLPPPPTSSPPLRSVESLTDS
jgi:hypothetical protein